MTGNAPTATYRQHVEDIEAPRIDAREFRQAWRKTTRLGALLADGSLTRDEHDAAVEYGDACIRLSPGMAGPRSERTSGGVDVHDRQLELVKVAARVRRVEERLGDPRLVKLCRSVVVLDRSWRELGRWLGCDRGTARRVAVAVLKVLAAHWERRASTNIAQERHRW